MSDPTGPEEQLKQQFMKLHKEIDAGNKARARRVEPINPADYAALCKRWAREDSTPLREGLNLLCRCHPEKSGWDSGTWELWTLAQRCIGPGGSLHVTNPDEWGIAAGKAWKYTVRPAELLDWAEQKHLEIPPELMQAVRGIPQTTRTAPANRSRQSAKQRRQILLRAFIDEIYRRAADRGHEWARIREPLPVTKSDVRDAFYRLHKGRLGRKISAATFEGDLQDVGAKFSPGIKRNVNNVLTDLFDGLK